MSYPILYSFRRCPYAMRARMGIYAGSAQVELREIVLKNKPSCMLEYSPKGTVPVLVLAEDYIVDESIDVLKWGIRCGKQHSETLNALCAQVTLDDTQANELVAENDGTFKHYLDRYKYVDRFPGHSAQYYRQQGELFLAKLEALLESKSCLLSDEMSWVDIAVMPFVRQFAHVDKDWFYGSSYSRLIAWLDKMLESDIFVGVMKKYKPWQPEDEMLIFPER